MAQVSTAVPTGPGDGAAEAAGPEAPVTTGSGTTEPAQERRSGGARPMRIVVGVIGMVLTAWIVCNGFLAFAYYPGWFLNSKVIIGILAIVIGIGGSILFFRFLNMAIEGLPPRMSEGFIPYAFLLPGFSLIGLMLLYPTIQTIVYSFANEDSTQWVGLKNYTTIFSDGNFWQALLNNFLWILIVPALTVGFGLLVAVLADKLSPTGEKVSKSMIFLPMAISFVGASTIWGLIYAFNQTGLLNAILGSFGIAPKAWMQVSDGRLNSLLLMVILIWLQTGFAMVLLSSAIKGVPEDTVEAGRMDGAGEARIFWQIVLPQVKGTIVAVFITVLILVLKVFDIIYVMTNGRDKTDVIARLFFDKLFAQSQAGQASAIVVVLLILVLPILIYQVRSFRAEEANR